MISQTEYYRRLVLIVAIAAGLAVLAIGATFAQPAQAEPAAPVCISFKSAHDTFAGGAVLSNLITGDAARALSNAVSDVHHKPRYDLPAVLALIYRNGLVKVLGFDANGCLTGSALESLRTFDGERTAAGLPALGAMTPVDPAAAPKLAKPATVPATFLFSASPANAGVQPAGRGSRNGA